MTSKMTPREVMENYHQRSNNTLNCLRALPTTISLMMTQTHADGTPWWQRVEYPDQVFIHRTKIEFITKKWNGALGLTVDALARMLDSAETVVDAKEVKEARRLIFDAEPPMARNGVNQHTGGCDNIKPTQGGTSADYLRRRLKRDRVDLWERVVNGELSANAAAIKAGFKKKKTPMEEALAAFRRLSVSERREFLASVQAES